MEQLEIKDYSREEMAELVNVDAKNGHFKRAVETKLTEWGYDYKYSCRKITILKKPETAIDRLKEIMIRVYNLDIRCDAYGFACLIYALGCHEEFQIMPWGERVNYMRDCFGVKVDERTLYRWAEKLFKNEMLVKNKSNKIWWMTYKISGEKVREMVDFSKEYAKPAFDEYMEFRKNTYRDKYAEYRDKDMDEREANSKAWGDAFSMTYQKYHITYYSCSELMLNAIGEECQTIYELVEEIVEDTEEVA